MVQSIVQYFGFDINILENLDQTSRNRISLTGLACILVAGVSALLGAITFSNLCFDGRYFLPIFLLWGVFMLFVECIILGSNLKKRSVIISRVAICLLLGCFHCFALDQYVFDKGINNYLTRQYNATINRLENTFTSRKITPLKTEQAKLRQRIETLHREVAQKRKRFYEEVTEGANGRPEGMGPYAAFKLKEYKRDSTQAARLTATNDKRIRTLRQRTDSLNQVLAKQKEKIVKPDEAGMLDFTNALFHRVFYEGDFMTIMLFFLLFLFGLFIESLTLLAKLGFSQSFKMYHDAVARKRKLLSKKHEREYENEDKLDELNQSKTLQEKVSAIERDIQINSINNTQQLSVQRLNARLEAVKDKSNLIFQAIKKTGDMDEKIREILDDDEQYREYGKPLVIEYRLDKIKEISDDVHGEDA